MIEIELHQVRSYLFSAIFLLFIAFASGCTSDECSQNSDCPTEQICAISGGIFWSGNSCIPITFPDLDATDNRDTDSPDTTDTTHDTTPLEDTDDDTSSPDVTPADVAPTPTCDDELQNGDETDIDCGGPVCTACQLEQSCQVHQDCASGRCDQNRCAQTAFITVWNTANPGGSNIQAIHLPLVAQGNYDFTVDWGDGKTDNITHGDQPEATHQYAEPGQYTVTITGLLEGWSFHSQTNAKKDAEKLIEIKNWGTFRLGTSQQHPPGGSQGYFKDARKLTISATDTPDLKGTTSLKNMFNSCSSLTIGPSINRWDVSTITDMTGMFAGASVFNSDIGDWNMSAVTTLTSMFASAAQFNQDIGRWDVSSVTHMSLMFFGALQFNQDIGRWDVSSVTDMLGLFFSASRFNQDISRWDVSAVKIMRSVFVSASAFNHDIGRWDMSAVTDTAYMFHSAESFNQNLSRWNVSSVTNMDKMFTGAALSTANYDALLLGWSSQIVRPDVRLEAANIKYSPAAVNARNILTSAPNNWTIIDGGPA